MELELNGSDSVTIDLKKQEVRIEFNDTNSYKPKFIVNEDSVVAKHKATHILLKTFNDLEEDIIEKYSDKNINKEEMDRIILTYKSFGTKLFGEELEVKKYDSKLGYSYYNYFYNQIFHIPEFMVKSYYRKEKQL